MELFFEKLAHFTHGMALMFFIVVCIQLHAYKTKSRLLSFLFYEAIFFVFLELKDMLYLIEGIWKNDYFSDIMMSIDMWCVPLTMLFLFELMSSKWVTLPKASLLISPSVIFTFLLAIVHSDLLFQITTVYSLILGFGMLIVVFMASTRYDNHIKKNFSYTEGLSVLWVRTIIVSLFIYLLLWFFLFKYDYWVGDVFYYLITILMWSLIYVYTLKHAVVDVPYLLNPFKNRECDNPENDAAMSDSCGKSYPFAGLLDETMTEGCLYMNPNLTISDVASAVGTNRTYLSDYLNKQLNTTFFEYVNAFRVSRACNILTSEQTQSLEQTAEQCGFNSLSTFRRAFGKTMNCTPAEYKKRFQS